MAPENTMTAIRNAIRLKADFIEIDVRTTKDGALVIMHDSKVDRTTNGHGAVKEMSLDEIKRLEIPNRFDSSSPEHVPTFDEVLNLAKGKVNIYLDHKEADTSQVLAALKTHGMERNIIVYNGVEGVKEWKRLAPAIPIMPSLPSKFRKAGGVAEFENDCPAEILDGHVREWTADLVSQAHALGVKVYVDIMGPEDFAEGYAKAVEMGVDGIQTDHPDRLVEFLRGRSKQRATDRLSQPLVPLYDSEDGLIR